MNSSRPIGQWMDDVAAEQFIAGKLPELSQGAKSFDLPPGIGRQINPDGTFSPANRATLVPSKSGVRTAYPFTENGTMTPAEQEILDLTARLGVEYHLQDWGICNADAERVREFIRVCQTEPLTQAQRYAMGELVFASMNEALAENVDKAPIDEFQAFLSRDFFGFAQQIRYWSSLNDSGEFPLSALLRSGTRVELTGLDKSVGNPIPAR